MWRMFRAALLGVVIGVIGGAIVGQVSYVRNYRDRLAKEIRSNAVMYNNGSSDGNGMIRIKVNYDGDGTDSEKDEKVASYVGNVILDEVEKWLGDDYSSRYSYVEMRRNLNMAMSRIDEIAQSVAYEMGADVDSNSQLSYEYFDDCGEECPAGFYNTLDVSLVDR